MSPELTGTELTAARNAVAIFEMEIRTHLHDARQLEKRVAAMYDFVGYTHFVKAHRAEGLRTRIGELKAMTAALETELTDLEEGASSKFKVYGLDLEHFAAYWNDVEEES